MKIFYFSIITIILLSFQSIYAQTFQGAYTNVADSSIIVKKKNETYFVSGVVADEQIKNQVIEIIKNYGGGNINADNLKIEFSAGYLSSDWQIKFTEQISKTKTSKTAFVQFKTDPNHFPNIPEKLLNAEIIQTENNEVIKLKNYKDDIIILSFVAHWSGPAQITIKVLNNLYVENLTNVRIIAVNTDTEKDEILVFRKFVKLINIKFQTGSSDKDFLNNFFGISNFNGVPQSFVIKDGKLRGIFLGSAPKVNETLVDLVRKISNEQTLNK